MIIYDLKSYMKTKLISNGTSWKLVLENKA